jgi:hypothetical protein
LRDSQKHPAQLPKALDFRKLLIRRFLFYEELLHLLLPAIRITRAIPTPWTDTAVFPAGRTGIGPL